MPRPTPNQFSGIFVSYRRDDSSGHAGRLFDRLVHHFGKDRIFMDIDNIEPGEDFVTVIENAVGSCEILIAVIGRSWISSPDDSRWLDNPNDFVRLEIGAALNRDIRVIPVLVQKAVMPKSQDLPDELSRLSRRNALELSDHRWQFDVDQLIGALERILAAREEARQRTEQEAEERRREEEAETRKQEELRRREVELREREAEEKANRLAAETERIKREVQAVFIAERAREQQVSYQKARAENEQQAREENEQKDHETPLRESATKAVAKNDLSLETNSLRSETASDIGTTVIPADPELSMEVNRESQSDKGSVAAKEVPKEARKKSSKRRDRFIAVVAILGFATIIIVAALVNSFAPRRSSSPSVVSPSTESTSSSAPASNSSSPLPPHVIRNANGLAPTSGWRWVNKDDPKDLRVELLPGLIQPKEGTYEVGPGYEWVNPNDQSDRRVQLKRGLILTIDGRLTPAPGYRWVSNDDPKDVRVEQIPP
jgi:hypothetical protein